MSKVSTRNRLEQLNQWLTTTKRYRDREAAKNSSKNRSKQRH